MSQTAQPRVGFFQGAAAVLRATVHVFGLVLSVLGRAIAALTRRTRGALSGSNDHE